MGEQTIIDTIDPHLLADTYVCVLPHDDNSNLIIVGSFLAVAVALALAIAISSCGKTAADMTIGIVGVSGVSRNGQKSDCESGGARKGGELHF